MLAVAGAPTGPPPATAPAPTTAMAVAETTTAGLLAEFAPPTVKGTAEEEEAKVAAGCGEGGEVGPRDPSSPIPPPNPLEWIAPLVVGAFPNRSNAILGCFCRVTGLPQLLRDPTPTTVLPEEVGAIVRGEEGLVLTGTALLATLSSPLPLGWTMAVVGRLLGAGELMAETEEETASGATVVEAAAVVVVVADAADGPPLGPSTRFFSFEDPKTFPSFFAPPLTPAPPPDLATRETDVTFVAGDTEAAEVAVAHAIADCTCLC